MSDAPTTMWVVWTNTDLTEGRGRQIPIAWHESQTDAINSAHKKGVMGSDASVKESPLVKRGAQIYGPVNFQRTTSEGRKGDAARQTKAAIVQKMLDAGLTPDEIQTVTA